MEVRNFVQCNPQLKGYPGECLGAKFGHKFLNLGRPVLGRQGESGLQPGQIQIVSRKNKKYQWSIMH